MSNLHSYAQLTFITKTHGNIVINSIGSKIISVSTQKDISQPYGVFSIQLAPSLSKDFKDSVGNRLQISDVFQPMDLVKIEFKIDERGYKTEMMGVISKAYVDLTISEEGKPFELVKIEGFDLGRLLFSFKMFFNPFLTTNTGQEFGGKNYFGNNSTLFNNLNPASFIQTFFSFVFGSGPNTKGPIYPFILNGKNVISYIDTFSGIDSTFTSNTMTDPFILLGIESGQEVPVWDIVKAYSDPPFHEVFVDLRKPTNPTDANSVKMAESTHNLVPLNSSSPGFIASVLENNPNISTSTVLSSTSFTFGVTPQFNQPYVVTMRTTPFSLSDWFNLNSHDLFVTDIINQDVSISEDNIFNYFEVWCERENFFIGNIQIANLSAETANKIPIFDNLSIQKFGLKRFPQNSTKYVEFIKKEDSNNSTIWSKQAQLAKKLFEWFSFGERFECGTITIKGRVGVDKDGITMGSRLIEKNAQGNETGRQFYIEGISQNFALGQSLKTTLVLTRGHDVRTRFEDVSRYANTDPSVTQILSTGEQVNGLGLTGSVFGNPPAFGA